MAGFSILGRGWKTRLSKLVESASRELLISSPYVTRTGADFVVEHFSVGMRESGKLSILTNLSPMNVCQGSTEPIALRSLSAQSPASSLFHLPLLHAKVYIADTNRAIVTSGNLTAGGLHRNYEYGIEVVDRRSVRVIREDIVAYAELGVRITEDRLSEYCDIANEVRKAYRKKQATTVKSAQRLFELALQHAEDELIRVRLAGGPMHTVFAKTIVYLLRQHGPLQTVEIHPLVQAIHPELCDDGVDRVIDGKRFGKKWKHAVRTAQQQLKEKRLIRLTGTRWISTSKSDRKERKHDSS